MSTCTTASSSNDPLIFRRVSLAFSLLNIRYLSIANGHNRTPKLEFQAVERKKGINLKVESPNFLFLSLENKRRILRSMIHFPDGSSRRRRILTFPAVHTGEAVSPATLLSSLVAIAGDICRYRSKPFASNRRNARETIRLVENLLIFLEEVQPAEPLPGSAALSFSELHLVFQKIRFLLEDCSRDGARIFILTKAERVANRFLQLVRTIATALDVLQLNRIDVAAETKEVVGLVMRQSRNEGFGLEEDDRRVSEEVLAILGKFQRSAAPEADELQWVLGKLGIRSWSDCSREIRFLEEEISLESGSPSSNAVEGKDLAFLNGLVGLMSYCRCVVFDEMPSRVPRECEARKTNVVLNFLNPDDFRCPISLEIMVDPVTTSTGQTYDRSSILKWFKAGNSTCPKTGKTLTSFELIPNLVLRGLIHQFCDNNGIPIGESGARKHTITRAAFAGSPAAKMAAGFLVERLAVGTEEERIKAAYEIRLLTKRNIFNRSCLVDAGAIPRLVRLLSSADSLTQEDAMASLLNLSKHSKGREILVDSGGLKSISEVLKSGQKLEVRQLAAAALYYLASVKKFRKMICEEFPEAVSALVELIKEGSDHGKKNALVAILGLLMYPENHRWVLWAGAVPVVVRLLSSSKSDDLIIHSLAVLACLGETHEGTLEILAQRGAAHKIVGLLSSSGSNAVKEHCISLLLALCIKGGRDVVSLLVKSPCLMAPLYSQLTEGTPRASKKASSLISLLHGFCERNSNGSLSPSFPQERFVHVW